MSSLGSLAGCNCLVTGASRGLGAWIARAFWTAGGNLLLVARGEAALNDVVADLADRPGQRAEVLVADLGDPSAPERIAARAKETFERLDVLVNNAAIQDPIGPSWENSWEQWQAAIRVNLLAPVALCRLVVPWMAERRRGKIINLSGGGATGPRPNFSAYAVSKTALVRFSEILAAETSDLGISVNCIAPGAMATAMLQSIVQSGPSLAGEGEYETALRIVGEGSTAMERATRLCLFLASEEGEGISGKLISAVWDPWEELPGHLEELRSTDVYTLRRIVPKDRGLGWGERQEDESDVRRIDLSAES